METGEGDPGWRFLRLTHEQMLAETSRPYDSKVDCWVPDPEEVFIAAKITNIEEDLVSCTTAKGEDIQVKKDKVYEMNPPKFEKTEDMANLTFLNEAAVLYNLRSRYAALMIYTYSGLFCVVINPYKRLPIYTESMVALYSGRRRNEMPPHLFAASDEAYRNMVYDRENQSMLITGESGAGKTENTKKVISYFALVGSSGQTAVDADGKPKATLEDQIVQTNPVLEAFGNAKTVRNNNSSRFGKFIRTWFNSKGKLAGGDIEHYLLEKSRTIRQAPGERCYHIFYQMFTSEKIKEMTQLEEDIRYYHFVSQAELKVEGMDDAEELVLTQEAFNIMGFTEEETNNLYMLCAANMHMGEMKFKQRGEQAEPDGEEVGDARRAAANFTIDHEEFLKALCKPRVKVAGEWVNKGQTLDQVNWAVGALAKGIYDRMFTWIIDRCNQTLSVDTGMKKERFIGVLDIAGFEIFDFNSFEQLWINFVNEKLQQFFNHHMFVLEQEEYAREGIQWTFIDFGLDLAHCIELIEKPMGIISMLDEECVVPKGSDMTYAQKLLDQHLGKHPNFEKAKPPKGKQADAHYAIRHYAGTVRYNVSNWLEKNKDPLNDTVIAVMKHATNNPLLVACWHSFVTQEEMAEIEKAEKEGKAAGGRKHGKSASMMTVSMLYREGLHSLMGMLNLTHPHFIRCIIPNEIKKCGYIEAPLVLHQLTCNGVLEGIRICRKGYPNRMQFKDFKIRYTLLAADAGKSDTDPLKASGAILKTLVGESKIDQEDFREGATKIFFKAGVLAKLEDLRDVTMKRIFTSLQTHVKTYWAIMNTERRKIKEKSRKLLQKNVRNWLELRNWDWLKLYGKMKPYIEESKIHEKHDKLKRQHDELNAACNAVDSNANNLQKAINNTDQEMLTLKDRIQREKGGLTELEEKIQQLESEKTGWQSGLEAARQRVDSRQQENQQTAADKRRAEEEHNQLKAKIKQLEVNVKKVDGEKAGKQTQVAALSKDMDNQSDNIQRLTKEKKALEELGKRLLEELNAEEDKIAFQANLKGKMGDDVNTMQSNVDREKAARHEAERHRRKLDADLRIARENLNETQLARHDVEMSLRKKDTEMNHANGRNEEQQSKVAKLVRQIKEATQMCQHMQDELDIEAGFKKKLEQSRADVQHDVQQLHLAMDDAQQAYNAIIETNKARESDLARLRREMEAASMNHESAVAVLRKKQQDTVGELGAQLEQMALLKARAEKERTGLQRDATELQSELDAAVRQRVETEKHLANAQQQLEQIEGKVAEERRELTELSAMTNRLADENQELGRQLEQMDINIEQVYRAKSAYMQQLEEMKQLAAQEEREKLSVNMAKKTVEAQNESLQTQVAEEADTKADLQRQLAKAQQEVLQWKAKYESEGLAKIEELENARRKLMEQIGTLQDSLTDHNNKIQAIEKNKQGIAHEIIEAQGQIEKASATATALEKKHKGYDQVLLDWQQKCADSASELDACQRENRSLANEVFVAKNACDELNEQTDGTQRENKNLSLEIKDLADQLADGGRSVMELSKAVKKLELEKEEVANALAEGEALLETEENKQARAQQEVIKLREDIERRIRDKEDEFNNTRKNHEQALASLNATLENECRSKQEALRMKKKLEGDINELEIALDLANKANADAQRQIQKHQETIRDLQTTIDDAQRINSELGDSVNGVDKRILSLQADLDHLATQTAEAERRRQECESELAACQDQVKQAHTLAETLNMQRRRMEADMAALKSDLDEGNKELKDTEEKTGAAMADASRLAEELRQEQEHTTHVERMKHALAQHIRELHVRLDEAEAAALKGGKKTIAKLQMKIGELEKELDTEQRRHTESVKHASLAERKTKELEFEISEDKNSEERMQDLLDKLQQKLKVYKRQIDDAEEVSALNLSKFRQLQQQYDDAEERADVAENMLAKMRARTRNPGPAGPAPPQKELDTSLLSSPSLARVKSSASASDVLDI